ncbi:hypothetical protein DQ238_10550 [Geodermatophilus sp. TF02-6]|uniref:hypothetical protein n=1 Tax=Geodermatophilus sp. TF02-6 TaxID=2250575 RepID=UPI000DE9887E|nr:hypothetical protein [Geodermatophilus sp. TF02-6]RBY79619.1 hypothetical protein DQ238_10550 [Geodermatophilus sp. TF02-6]
MSEPQVVVGGTVAALTAADALADRGRPTRLFLPRRGVGGGFVPLVRDGRTLERGMRVLELHYEGTGTPPPLARYRPDEEGHRPFVALVDAWVRELVGDDAVVPVAAPASFLGGRLGPEVLLSSDLSRAAELVPADVAGRIAAEAAQAAAASGDAGLLAPDRRPRLWETTFDDVSAQQHGLTFHDVLLAPFVAKVRPAGGSDVLAALRRKLWVPLFWPRTVAEAFGGAPVGFVPQRPLTVVRPGGTGPVVRALLDRLRARGVEVVAYDRLAGVAADGRRVRIEFSDGRVETATRPVLGVPAGELFAAAGTSFAPAKVGSVLAWVGVREADLRALPGFVDVLDADVAAYRVTPGAPYGAGCRVVCVELAHDVPQEAAARTAHGVLQRVGLLRAGAAADDLGVFAGPTFTDPTADNLRLHAAALDRWRDLAVPATVVGGAQAPFADSFNEQVLQGLQAAASTA